VTTIVADRGHEQLAAPILADHGMQARLISLIGLSRLSGISGTDGRQILEELPPRSIEQRAGNRRSFAYPKALRTIAFHQQNDPHLPSRVLESIRGGASMPQIHQSPGLHPGEF